MLYPDLIVVIVVLLLSSGLAVKIYVMYYTDSTKRKECNLLNKSFYCFLPNKEQFFYIHLI